MKQGWPEGGEAKKRLEERRFNGALLFMLLCKPRKLPLVNATAHNSPTSSTLEFISFLQKAYVSGDLLRSQRWVQDVPNHRQMHVCSLKQSIGKVRLRNKSDPGISGFTWISQIVTAFTQGCSHVKALADGSWIYQATSIGPTIVGKSHTCSHAQNGKFALGLAPTIILLKTRKQSWQGFVCMVPNSLGDLVHFQKQLTRFLVSLDGFDCLPSAPRHDFVTGPSALKAID